MQQQRLKQQHALMQQALYHNPSLMSGPQIEPILSGNLPPGFDAATCRSVYVGNIHPYVTEPLLQEVFLSTGPIEGCKLIKKDKSSYGFVDYFDRRSAALAIVTLNGRHLFGQPIKVNWAYASNQREDTSGMLGLCGIKKLAARKVLVLFLSGTSRLFQISIILFWRIVGKWLGSRQIRCNCAAKGATSNNDKSGLDAKGVVEPTNGTSEEGQEKTNDDAPENNPQYTTVYVGNLAPEVTSVDLHRLFHTLGAGTIEDVRVQRDKGFGFVRYSLHTEAALAIQMGNARILCGKPIKPFIDC
ncbi:hypothetical protein GOBAR_AA04908 [Gossypium barbadense]|uniref:RRM domain-containing protein n=1 Tax=Gossypium barbadense TaxID=3634 RepID=A0A2P5YJD2_GOSBA|nr:hypothetical protein GOBAR_AA04908 [Gossypium barbadense]